MDFTSIVLALLGLACLGFLGYLLMQIPMMAPFQDIIRFVIVVLMILYMLGLMTGTVGLPHLGLVRQP